MIAELRNKVTISFRTYIISGYELYLVGISINYKSPIEITTRYLD